ncbi:MAG: GumC family protein [Alphaproteobacteria bacterium]|nr:GumC family protein [Alphaproteobacteria bacterium]
MDKDNENRNSGASSAEAAAKAGTNTIRDIVSIIWQRRRYVIAGAVLGLVITILMTASMAPKYVSKATLLVDLRELEVSQNGLMPTVPATVLETLANSEKSILYSNRVLDRVVIENDLENNPEFVGGSALGKIKASIKGLFGLGQTTSDLRAVAAKALLEKLDVQRKKDTVILTIAVSTQDPQLSQRINQSILNNYLIIRDQSAQQSSVRVVSALENQLDEQVKRVTQAEGAVEQYKIENNIIDADGRLNNEQQINTITDQLSSAQLETARLQSRYDQYRNIIRSGSAGGADSGVFQSPVMATLRTRLLETQDEQAALAVSLGRNHPRMVEINQRIASLKNAIRGEADKDLNAVQQELNRATELENALQQELAALQQKTGNINQTLVPLRDLERKAEAARSVYVATLTRIREISAQQNVDSSNVRVVSDPTLPTKNERISKSLLAMLGGLFGMSFGAFVGLVTQPGGTRVAPPQNDISATGLPVLARFPVGSADITPPHRAGGVWAGPRLFDLPRNSAVSAFSLEPVYDGIVNAGRVPANDDHYAKTILFLGIDSSVSTSVYAANFAACSVFDRRSVLLVDGVATLKQLNRTERWNSDNGGEAPPGTESMLTRLSRLRNDPAGHDADAAIEVDCLVTASSNPGRPRSDASVMNRLANLSPDYNMIVLDGGQLNEQAHLKPFSQLASDIVLVVQERASMLDALDEAHDLLNGARDKVIGCIVLSSQSQDARYADLLENRDLQLRLSTPVKHRMHNRAERVANVYR